MPSHETNARRTTIPLAVACALLAATFLAGCAARPRPRPAPARTQAAAARSITKAPRAIDRDVREPLDEADANSVDPDAR
jgi:hypothetical protein